MSGTWGDGVGKKLVVIGGHGGESVGAFLGAFCCLSNHCRSSA